MGRSRIQQIERTLGMATRFLEEVRTDIEGAAREGGDIAPRIRSVHVRQGHATPEFRTISIPIPDDFGSAPPGVLSGTVALYARRRPPDCLLLAMEAEMDDGGTGRPVLIAEARDRAGTRMYCVQPYRTEEGRVEWEEPLAGGWRDPGGEEMILDAAFSGAEPPRPARRTRRRRGGRRPVAEPAGGERPAPRTGAAPGRAR